MTENDTRGAGGGTPLWKRAATVGAVGAAVLAGGGIAFAATGTGGGNGGAGAAAEGPQAAGPLALRHQARKLGGRALYGTLVTKGKDGGTVTHVLARGTVSAVSPTSLTVRSVDGHTTTYALDAQTVVRERTRGTVRGTKGAISDLAVGDSVAVAGRGTPPTATIVVEVSPAASSPTPSAPPSGSASGTALES